MRYLRAYCVAERRRILCSTRVASCIAPAECRRHTRAAEALRDAAVARLPSDEQSAQLFRSAVSNAIPKPIRARSSQLLQSSRGSARGPLYPLAGPTIDSLHPDEAPAPKSLLAHINFCRVSLSYFVIYLSFTPFSESRACVFAWPFVSRFGGEAEHYSIYKYLSL